MRCFVAVDIDDILRQKMINLQKDVMPFIIGNPVEPENLHFTLKFLGELDDSQIGDIKKTLSDISGNFEKFDVDITGIGAFPNKNYVKVVWVGAPKLFNLQKAVADSLESFGQEHDIIPHLTLARVKNVNNKSGLLDTIEKYENMHFGTLSVTNIKLKKSELAANGPIYEDVVAYYLA
mgnify:CR=1 FL=1